MFLPSLATVLMSSVPASALAQQMDHSMHQGHAGHDQPEEETASAQPEPDPHAGHGMPMDHGAHAGHDTPVDHSQHVMPPAEPATDHSAHQGHDMPSADDPPEIPVNPIAFSGPEHAADLVFEPEEMRQVRANVLREHGDMTVTKLFLERFEASLGDGEGYAWDLNAWIGKDINKLWIKSEGEGAFDKGFERGEVQALWSHAIGPWFDLQAGVRQDFGPGPQRSYAVIGVQGLAPYWFEVDGAIFVSDKGDVTARIEAEHDMRITTRLILQPRIEVALSAQNVPDLRLGSGLTDASMGLRLRYEITPQFAPYIGVEWENSFGGTRDYARLDGEKASRVALLMGTRFWF